MKFVQAKRIAPDVTPYFAATYLELLCLLMSNKKEAMPILVKSYLNIKCALY